MSNTVGCPKCSRIGSDSVWPSEGWGYFVTQHDVDGTNGTEDPAAFTQTTGEKMYRCPCDRAVWFAGIGWLVAVNS